MVVVGFPASNRHIRVTAVDAEEWGSCKYIPERDLVLYYSPFWDKCLLPWTHLLKHRSRRLTLEWIIVVLSRYSTDTSIIQSTRIARMWSVMYCSPNRAGFWISSMQRGEGCVQFWRCNKKAQRLNKLKMLVLGLMIRLTDWRSTNVPSLRQEKLCFNWTCT